MWYVVLVSGKLVQDASEPVRPFWCNNQNSINSNYSSAHVSKGHQFILFAMHITYRQSSKKSYTLSFKNYNSSQFLKKRYITP